LAGIGLLGDGMRFLSTWILLGALILLSFASAEEKEKKIERSQLPPKVEKAMAALTENSTIRGFRRENEHGQTYYEVELTVGGHHKDILLDTQGEVVEIEQEVALGSLPAAVQDALQGRARQGKLRKVESITKHGRLVAYEAQVLNNGERSEIQVGPEGEFLNHEE
jgi:hypothetical protein